MTRERMLEIKPENLRRLLSGKIQYEMIQSDNGLDVGSRLPWRCNGDAGEVEIIMVLHRRVDRMMIVYQVVHE